MRGDAMRFEGADPADSLYSVLNQMLGRSTRWFHYQQLDILQAWSLVSISLVIDSRISTNL
jgi:hypothetical protein